jgi:hypothetical protein
VDSFVRTSTGFLYIPFASSACRSAKSIMTTLEDRRSNARRAAWISLFEVADDSIRSCVARDVKRSLINQSDGKQHPPQRRAAKAAGADGRREFQALDYLVFNHEAVQAFGLPAATAQAAAACLSRNGLPV